MSTALKSAIKFIKKSVATEDDDFDSPTNRERASSVCSESGEDSAELEERRIRRVAPSSSSKKRRAQLLKKNHSTSGSESLLHFAVAEEDIELTLQILTTDETDVNFLRPPGISVLHQACILGNLELMRLLIENGADVHQKNFEGLTPLHLTVVHGNFDAAMYLINQGVDTVEIKNGFQLETSWNGYKHTSHLTTKERGKSSKHKKSPSSG